MRNKVVGLSLVLMAVLSGFSSFSRAEGGDPIQAKETKVNLVETCSIDSELELTEPTVIHCDRDLKISAERLKVKNAKLSIIVMGSVEFPKSGVSIEFENSAPFQLSARSATGRLGVVNAESSKISYASVWNYAQNISSQGTSEFVLNGTPQESEPAASGEPK